MTWPFENNTNGIVKNLAKRSLKADKRSKFFCFLQSLFLFVWFFQSF